MASVPGREFSREQLMALVPGASEAIERGLDRLVEEEILRPPGGRRATYRFRHGLIRDAAYESRIGEHRRLYEDRAAAVLA